MTHKVEALVVDERQAYVLTLLETYRSTPGTAGTVRRPDRLLAGQLYDRGIPLTLVQNALVLATARRLFRHPHAPPLAIIRSLAYYLDIIEEVRGLDDDYFQYLRAKLRNLPPAR